MKSSPTPEGDLSISVKRRAELKKFLRAKRERLSPEEVGLQRGLRRLTPGLRREEVAASAGVGLSWYTWLEQGREINISANALSRIARALRLSEADRAYLYWLAGLQHPPPVAITSEEHRHIQTVLDAYRWPAFAVDPVWNMLATNRIGRHLYGMDDLVGPFFENQLWQYLMNPRRQALYRNHEADAEHFIAVFRLGAATRLGDPAFQRFLTALQTESALFARLWAGQRAEPATPRPVELLHPEWGPVRCWSIRFPVPSEDGGMIFFLSPADDVTSKAWSRFAHADAGPSAGSPAVFGGNS
jgi:transcriptional regulator with XRE-family HTH domain